MIVDLDGRLNLNVVGDPYQRWLSDGSGNYATTLENGSDTNFARSGLSNRFLPQGLGYGPAEISLARLFGPQLEVSWMLVMVATRMRRNILHVSGKAGQERVGRYFQQRELRIDGSGFPYGLKQARRGTIAYGLDRLGNVRMSDVVGGPSNELVDDAYEVNSQDFTSGDALVTIEEIEALLRRYDADASQLLIVFEKFLRLWHRTMRFSARSPPEAPSFVIRTWRPLPDIPRPIPDPVMRRLPIHDGTVRQEHSLPSPSEPHRERD